MGNNLKCFADLNDVFSIWIERLDMIKIISLSFIHGSPPSILPLKKQNDGAMGLHPLSSCQQYWNPDQA